MNVLQFLLLNAHTDARYMFQPSATPVMDGIINLHNDIMFFIIGIVILVFYILFRTIYIWRGHNPELERLQKVYQYQSHHHTSLEILWTIFPMVVLAFIIFPSFSLLYSIDDSPKPLLTVKVIGNQWYWRYEFLTTKANSLGTEFEARLKHDISDGEYRLLTTDNILPLPTETTIKFLFTSADVLHSWAVPAFGIKMDCCPGRINVSSLYIYEAGMYYGQCSELCGVQHGFMPIAVNAIALGDYIADLEIAKKAA